MHTGAPMRLRRWAGNYRRHRVPSRRRDKTNRSVTGGRWPSLSQGPVTSSRANHAPRVPGGVATRSSEQACQRFKFGSRLRSKIRKTRHSILSRSRSSAAPTRSHLSACQRHACPAAEVSWIWRDPRSQSEGSRPLFRVMIRQALT